MPTRFKAVRLPGGRWSTDSWWAWIAADPDLRPAGAHRQAVVHGHPAAEERPGHDRARPLGGERAVDPQAGSAGVGHRGGDPEGPSEGGPELVQAEARGRGHLDHLGVGQEGPGDPVGQLEAGDAGQVGSRPGPPSSARSRRARRPPARGCAGAPRTGASTPPKRRPRTGRPRRHPPQRACWPGSARGRARPRRRRPVRRSRCGRSRGRWSGLGPSPRPSGRGRCR